MSWTHPYSPAERQEYPIELEAFYRTSDTTTRGTWKTTYVEADPAVSRRGHGTPAAG